MRRLRSEDARVAMAVENANVNWRQNAEELVLKVMHADLGNVNAQDRE